MSIKYFFPLKHDFHELLMEQTEDFVTIHLQAVTQLRIKQMRQDLEYLDSLYSVPLLMVFIQDNQTIHRLCRLLDMTYLEDSAGMSIYIYDKEKSICLP